jgi:hypothetical protein
MSAVNLDGRESRLFGSAGALLEVRNDASQVEARGEGAAVTKLQHGERMRRSPAA